MTSTDDTPAEDTPRGLPVVRLKPKAEARAIRHGFPWVYADELVTDRRTQGLAPGALAVDPAGRPTSAERLLESVTKVPIHCGWQEVATTDPGVRRRWVADEGGDGVVLDIVERKSDFLVSSRARPGHRLRSRRRSVQSSEAAAEQQARAWLTQAVSGRPL